MHLVEQGWGKKVTAVLHHLPEDEGFEDDFEAVTGSERDSAEAALKHLVSDLTMFGFVRLVAVENLTMIEWLEQYEIRVDWSSALSSVLPLLRRLHIGLGEGSKVPVHSCVAF